MSKCEWCDYKENEWLLHRSLDWSVYLADVQDYVGRCILVLNSLKTSPGHPRPSGACVGEE